VGFQLPIAFESSCWQKHNFFSEPDENNRDPFTGLDWLEADALYFTLDAAINIRFAVGLVGDLRVPVSRAS